MAEEFNKLFFFRIVFLAAIFAAFFFVSFNTRPLVAHATLNLNQPSPGSPLLGTLVYDLRGDGSLPLDSIVSMSINGYVTKKPIRELFTDNSILEEVRQIDYNPRLHVEIEFEDYGGPEDQPNRIAGSSGDSPSASTPVVPDGDSPPAPSEGASEGESSSIEVPPSAFSIGFLKSLFTSRAVSDTQTEITVRAGHPTTIYVPSGKRALVHSVSLNSRTLDPSIIMVSHQAGSATFTTEYTETLRGFSFPNPPEITLDLSRFNSFVPTKSAYLEIEILYGTELLASASRSFIFKAPPISSSSRSSGSKPIIVTSSNSLEAVSTAENLGCTTQPICTDFGECSIGALSPISTLLELAQPVRVQQCVYPDCGFSFVKTQVCTTSVVPLDVMPSDLPDDNSPTEIPDSTRNLPPNNAQSNRWAQTYRMQNDINSLTSMATELKESTRVAIKLDGIGHYIGVEKISSDNVEIIISSTPQSAIIYLGEKKYFDLDSDGLSDIELSIISLEKDSVSLLIVPLQKSLSSIGIERGERGVTLVSKENGKSLAHVLISDAPTLRILFVQSEDYNR